MGKVLIVDDDKSIVKSLEMTLNSKGIDTVSTTKGNEVLNLITPDVDTVLLDVNLGHFSGNDILKSIKEFSPLLPVIMISGLSSLDDAIGSIREGAFDFIQKPLQRERLLVSLQNALNFSKLRKKSVSEPIYSSTQMEKVISLAKKVASTNTTVLITGESGVGKDVIANYIHNLSKRCSESIVGINCGAIPETLIESELFGFKKGSFTSSVSDSEGKIFKSDKGTLFLDEIGELPLSSQVKLLRFLENGEIQRIGESSTIKVDTRLIVATNKDLYELVEEGTFREDLLYRLNIIHIEIPPLRDRKDDILQLVEKFNSDITKSMGIKPISITKEAMDYLTSYNYPGNIRQLKNIVERAIILCQNGTVKLEDIIIDKKRTANESIFDKSMALGEAKHILERKYIITQLKKYNNSVKETAKALEVLPNNLSRRIKDLGIKNDI